jgi:hypothetical protein
MKYYTVYKTTNMINGKIYIGCHQTENLDDDYLGSGLHLGRAIDKYGRESFKKEILHFCESVEDMFSMESKIVNEDFIQRKDVYNIKKGGEFGWSHNANTGRVRVRDKDGRCFVVSINDPRYINGELTFIRSGRIAVKDIDGNIIDIDKNDPRFLNKELVGCRKGTVIVSDGSGRCFAVKPNDIRYICGELNSIWKGRKHTDKTRKTMSEKKKGRTKGSVNSQYNTCWIRCDIISENFKIYKKDLDLYLDMKCFIKGRKFYNNGKSDGGPSIGLENQYTLLK